MGARELRRAAEGRGATDRGFQQIPAGTPLHFYPKAKQQSGE